MSNAEADRIDFDLGKDPLRRSEGMLLVGKNFCQFRGDARESKRRSMEQALERLEPPSLLLVVHARRLRQPHWLFWIRPPEFKPPAAQEFFARM